MNDRGKSKHPGGGKTPHWLDRTANRRRTHFARRPDSTERRRESVLRDWYGPDRASNEIGALRSPPRESSSLVDDVLSGIGFGESVALDKVKENWIDIVGPDVAKRTEPLALRNRVLTVEVPSATMRYVLKSQQYGVIRQALHDVTDGAVADVRFDPPGRLGGIGSANRSTV